jgi:hypothetical protein
MRDFCDGMQGAALDKPCVDHTGLTARYDFNLKWTPDESQFIPLGGYHPPATEDPNAPPALTIAIQEQLGLKIDSAKAPAPVFVIDKAGKALRELANTLSTPKTSGKPHNAHQIKHLRATKNLPISFTLIGKIEIERSKAPVKELGPKCFICNTLEISCLL